MSDVVECNRVESELGEMTTIFSSWEFKAQIFDTTFSDRGLIVADPRFPLWTKVEAQGALDHHAVFFHRLNPRDKTRR